MFLYYEFKEGNILGFESEFDLLNKILTFFDVTKERFSPNYSYILSQPFCGSHISPLFRKREGIKGVSLLRGWEDLISHFPFPKLTLSFSLSCPAIEGDDPRSSRGHLATPKWTLSINRVPPIPDHGSRVSRGRLSQSVYHSLSSAFRFFDPPLPALTFRFPPFAFPLFVFSLFVVLSEV